MHVAYYPIDPVLIHCFRGEWTNLDRLKFAGLKTQGEYRASVISENLMLPATTLIKLDKMEEGTYIAIITGGGKTTAAVVNSSKIAIRRVVDGNDLRFFVTDKETGKGIKGAHVKLFFKKDFRSSEKNLIEEENILEGYTDARGIILFIVQDRMQAGAPAIAQYGNSFATDR